MVKTLYEYIQFDLVRQDDKKKTQTYYVRNIKSQFILGCVKWYGPWRRYCFFTNDNIIFSEGCLNDISNFINQLMEERKNGHIN